MSVSAYLPPALVAALLVVPVTKTPRADPPGSPKPIDFDRDVKPILAKNCFACHGPDKQKGGLRLDRKADALTGGDSGAVIVAGKSRDSLLMQLVSGQDTDRVMPPKGERLSAAEVATLRAWIDQGATWPGDGSTTNAADWWSFKPITRSAVPSFSRDPKGNGWCRNPIDNFILTTLQDKGLSPSSEADRRTLIRRVYFDLIGLPPTPEEIDDFLADKS